MKNPINKGFVRLHLHENGEENHVFGEESHENGEENHIYGMDSHIFGEIILR